MKRSSSLCTLLLVFFAASLNVVFADDSASCTSFQINGPTPALFAYRRFYDFRRIRNDGSPLPNRNSSLSDTTAVVSYSVNDTSWTDDWDISVKPRPAPTDYTYPMQYTTNNVYIKNSTDTSPDYSTNLFLSTTRLATSQDAGEIVYSPSAVKYLSIRVLARVQGQPGAVAGVFTYYNDSTESDIEILTRDPKSSIEYSNQPTVNEAGDAIPGSNFNISRPSAGGRQWSDWNVHRLDWLPGISAWYLNGNLAASTKVHVPGGSEASRVIINMWSNGGFWSGNMSKGDKAELQIQWIEMVFNTSASSAASSSNVGMKKVVCSVDKVGGLTPVPAEGVIIMMTGRNGWGALLLGGLLLTGVFLVRL